MSVGAFAGFGSPLFLLATRVCSGLPPGPVRLTALGKGWRSEFPGIFLLLEEVSRKSIIQILRDGVKKLHQRPSPDDIEEFQVPNPSVTQASRLVPKSAWDPHRESVLRWQVTSQPAQVNLERPKPPFDDVGLEDLAAWRLPPGLGPATAVQPRSGTTPPHALPITRQAEEVQLK